jgi:hypothetical protein
MTLLEYVFIVAFAVSYTSELIALIFSRVISATILKNFLTPLLAYGSLWLVDIREANLLLSVLAASFIATVINIIINALNKPTVVPRNRNRGVY